MSILVMIGFVINAGHVVSGPVDNEDFKLSVGAKADEEWNEFKDAMWRERTPTIDEMMEAWERAGKPDGFRIITLASEAIDSTGEPEQFGVIALTHGEYKQYGWFRPTTAQIDWAFRDTAEKTPEEQLKIWADEYEAEQERLAEFEEEYREMCRQGRPIIAAEEMDTTTMLHAGDIHRDWFARMEELERELGAEAAKSEPAIVYKVIDGDTIQLQNDERSIEDCNKAIELNPNGADAYNNRGVAYCFLGHYKRAIEDFNKTMELNPNFIMAYSNRELALNKLEEKNSAPGFETIFAITGFLAVACRLRRMR